MSIIINPGSGPVSGATHENAAFNIQAFVGDLRDLGVTAEVTGDGNSEDGGRWLFYIRVDGRKHEVEMPGLPLRQVNFGAEGDDNIWDFPRLYIDGSSWVWPYALDACRREDDGSAA